MNLSCHKMMGSGAGDTLTITCFTCGMPSSKEWAQKISSRPTMPPRPFYPFLVTVQPPAGAVLKEDGTTFVCAFCHASLEAQWRNYERQPGTVPPANRKYSLYKFICAVCGVETYRKRVRTLPFQEFPFLANQRPPGSLTLGNNPLAVVCLDCSETLWAQSAEYDRWGLPVHKRRFNWLARPPPDPDSLEATVARLPSGETQLPRCPPTEPVLKPRESVHFESVSGQLKVKTRNSKSESNSGGSDSENPVRKTSLALMDQSGVHPPVVTVAPMSSHSVSLTVHRKDSLSVPTNVPSGYGNTLPCVPPPIGHTIFPRPAVFPSSSYGPYGWPAIDSSNDPYSYSSVDGLQSSSNASWSWLPPPQASSLIPYPSYLPTSYSGRSYSMSEPFYNSSHSYYPPSPEGNSSISTVTSTSNSSYMTPVTVARPSSPRNLQHQKSGHTGASSLMRNLTQAVATNDREVSPPPLITRKHTSADLRTVATKRPIQEIPLKKLIASKTGKPPPLEANPTRTSVSRKSFVIPNPEAPVAVKNTQPSPDRNEPPPPSTTFKPKSHAIRNHMNENLMIAKKWKKAALTETVIASRDSLNSMYSTVSPHDGYDDPRPPSKIFRRFSESEPVDFSVKERSLSTSSSSSLPSSYERCATADVTEDDIVPSRTIDDAMDLSVLSSQKVATPANGTSNKFMIAYLCQKEKEVENLSRDTQWDSRRSSTAIKNSNLSPAESSGRRSVIVTLPKPDVVETIDEAARSEVLSETSSIENNCIRVTENEACVDLDELKPQDSDTMPMGDRNEEDEDATARVGSRNSSEASVSNECEGGDMTTETVNPSEACDVNPTDDDDPQSDKLTSMKEYVQKIVGEYKEEAKQAELMQKKLVADQEDFLGNFGLVTLQKKSEVELENLISRSEHLTLPPLKLRPSTPPKVQLEKEFANKLLEIAFDDPSLKKCDLNEDEVAFLVHLGLKPASKLEKEKRETRWKVALMERMMRAKRGESLIGSKKPWDSESSFSRLLSICEVDASESKIFDTLSVTLPEEVGDKVQTNAEARPSDLLQIADTKSTDECGSSPPSKTNSLPANTPRNQPVISYPKYIPSYATTQASAAKKVSNELGNMSDERASKSVHQSNPKVKPGGQDVRFNSNNLLQVGDARILKVPVVNPSGPLVDSSRVNVTDEEKVNAETIQRKDGSVEPRDDSNSPACLDEIIRVDALNCENFVNQINNLLASMPVSPTSRSEKMDSQANWPSSAAEWRKLKKYLKSRQSQIKIIEEKLKKREKKILSHLRACASNTH